MVYVSLPETYTTGVNTPKRYEVRPISIVFYRSFEVGASSFPINQRKRTCHPILAEGYFIQAKKVHRWKEMSHIVFALTSRNPWYTHLEKLAQHLGASYYYVILTDKQPLSETLTRIPDDVKLVLISSTDVSQPTRLEEYKGSKFGKRAVANMTLDIPPFASSRDVHLNIMSFLSGKDVARSSRVSRDWESVAGLSSDWRSWLKRANQEHKASPPLSAEDFKKLGSTPVLAYQQARDILNLDDIITEFLRIVELHSAGQGLEHGLYLAKVSPHYMISESALSPVIAPASLSMLLARIQRLKDVEEEYYHQALYNLRYELGRRGTIPMIVEYHNILSDVFEAFDDKSYYSDDPIIRERLMAWKADTPERVAMKTFFLEAGDDFETAAQVWGGIDDRLDSEDVLHAISQALTPERFSNFKEKYDMASFVRETS